MTFSVNPLGQHTVTFTSPLNIDNGFQYIPQGNHESEMTLFLNEIGHPIFIEWLNPVTDCETIGIEYDGEEVIGYDGVFEIPKQAISLLEHAGFHVSNDLKED